MFSVVGALMTCGIACTPAPEPSAPSPVQRPTIPYSVQWSAVEGIDIQDRPAELIRATFDGGEMAAWAGVAHSFPGYADAVAGTRDYYDSLGSTTQPPKPQNLPPWASTVRYRHITTLNATDTHITARICTLRRFIKPFGEPTRYSGDGSFFGVSPHTLDIVLSKPADTSPGVPGERDDSPEHDPPGNNQPHWNVYGNWTIDAIHDPYGDNGVFGTEPECIAWWKQLFPGWTSVTRPGDFRPPHPVNGPWEWYNLLALDPPAPPSYPEWIAPKGADA